MRRAWLPMATVLLTLAAVALLLWRFAVVGPATTDGVGFWEGPVNRPPAWTVALACVLAALGVVQTLRTGRSRMAKASALVSAIVLLAVGGYVVWLRLATV